MNSKICEMFNNKFSPENYDYGYLNFPREKDIVSFLNENLFSHEDIQLFQDANIGGRLVLPYQAANPTYIWLALFLRPSHPLYSKNVQPKMFTLFEMKRRKTTNGNMVYCHIEPAGTAYEVSAEAILKLAKTSLLDPVRSFYDDIRFLDDLAKVIPASDMQRLYRLLRASEANANPVIGTVNQMLDPAWRRPLIERLEESERDFSGGVYTP